MNRASIWLLNCLLPLLACETKPAATATPAAPPAVAPAPALPASPPAPDSSRTTTFTWQDDACTNTGTFAAGAYTAEQLRDTHQLVTGFSLQSEAAPFELKDYTAAHFTQAADQLGRERDSVADVLQRMDVVPTPFWRRIRHLRELELAEHYRWQQAAIDGYFHPETWLRNPYTATCRAYATALASPDTLAVIHAWRQLTDEQKKNNGYPENLEARFQQQAVSPQRMAYAKLALLTFGWSNCANAQRKYNNLPDEHNLHPQFTKLFTRIERTDCEDVD